MSTFKKNKRQNAAPGIGSRVDEKQPSNGEANAAGGGSFPTGAAAFERSEGGGMDVGAERTQGLSNTPATTYNRPGIDFCIDYFKATIAVPFDPNSKDSMDCYSKVLESLYLTIQDAVPLGYGNAKYEKAWRFDEDLFIFSGGNLTLTSYGAPTSLIEMKGEACRRFEERAKNAERDNPNINVESNAFITMIWARFFKAASEYLYKVTRFDVPVDDIGGLVPLEELKAKVLEGALTSPMRMRDTTRELGEDEEGKRGTVREQGLGWSYALGGRTSQQLTIYDKRAQMEKKLGPGCVLIPHWVRYEVRYYKEKANAMFPQLLAAVSDPDPLAFQRFCVGCLASMVTFREKRLDGDNTYKSPVWGKWAAFIAVGELPQSVRLKKPILTIKRNADWFKKEVDRTLFRLAAAYPKHIADIIRYALQDGIAKATKDDLAIVNSSLEARGEATYQELADAQSAVFKAAGCDVLPAEAILALFDEKRTVELEKVTQEGDK